MMYGTITDTKMNIVIIGQNEGQHIKSMLTFLQRDLSGHKRIWVLDRCTDDSEHILQEAGEFIVKTPDYLKGRQTSYARNLGLKYTDPSEDVLFLDGDRYVTAGVLYNLTFAFNDVTLLMLEEDHRHNVTYSKLYGEVHNGFYSCGIMFKRKAINALLTFQNGWLFREDIQQEWGIEDVYLGDVCYHLGLSCDLYSNVSLRGGFDKTNIDDISTMEKRFLLRDKLDVKWQGKFNKKKEQPQGPNLFDLSQH